MDARLAQSVIDGIRLCVNHMDDVGLAVTARRDLQLLLDEIAVLQHALADGTSHEVSVELIADNLLANAIASADENKFLREERDHYAGEACRLWKALLEAQGSLREQLLDVATIRKIGKVLEETTPGKRTASGRWAAEGEAV